MNPKRLTGVAVGLTLVGCATPTPVDPEALARQALIVDTHIDLPYRLHRAPDDVTVATASGDFDLPRALEGGLDVAFMSIYVPAKVDEAGEAKAFADALIDGVESLVAAAPGSFAAATCVADVERNRVSRLISLPLGMENGAPIGGDYANVDYFRERGVRYVTLAHSTSNHISDSSYDVDERWQGLSQFGKTLIPVLNQRGIMVDVSHISDRAFWQVLERTNTPVIASHSSLRHFVPGFHRNMSDEMVAALGRQGGVIQINFGSSFVTRQARRWSDDMQAALKTHRASHALADGDPAIAAFIKQYRSANPYPLAGLDDVLDHIDRAVKLAGINHVGIGSDYDGVGPTLPVGLEDVSTYPNLIRGLARRGYDREEIEKILGGNLMRVWEEIEAYAAGLGFPPLCSQGSPQGLP
jgi:membrane dipeptidase